MTGLKVTEFDGLTRHFQAAWLGSLAASGKAVDEKRGCPSKLDRIEDKLVFILFYLKTYPLQEVLGYSFGLSQGVANQWIHRLCPVLITALRQSSYAPTRLPEDLLTHLEKEAGQVVGIDGTERRIQRPLDNQVQQDYYSGKKKPIPLKTT